MAVGRSERAELTPAPSRATSRARRLFSGPVHPWIAALSFMTQYVLFFAALDRASMTGPADYDGPWASLPDRVVSDAMILMAFVLFASWLGPDSRLRWVRNAGRAMCWVAWVTAVLLTVLIATGVFGIPDSPFPHP